MSEKKPDRIKEHIVPYESEPEFLGMEEDRYELIEGVRYDLKPAPTVNHQKISAALYILIYQTCHPNGTILYSPLDVYFDDDNQFQPDMIFVLHENAHIIKKQRIEGAPDLVIEILSPSTSQNDKILKKRQYARFGVKEYWILDPVHRVVDQFILDNGVYFLREIYGDQDTLTSPQFSCISIDFSRIFVEVN